MEVGDSCSDSKKETYWSKLVNIFSKCRSSDKYSMEKDSKTTKVRGQENIIKKENTNVSRDQVQSARIKILRIKSKRDGRRRW